MSNNQYLLWLGSGNIYNENLVAVNGQITMTVAGPIIGLTIEFNGNAWMYWDRGQATATISCTPAAFMLAFQLSGLFDGDVVSGTIENPAFDTPLSCAMSGPNGNIVNSVIVEPGQMNTSFSFTIGSPDPAFSTAEAVPTRSPRLHLP